MVMLNNHIQNNLKANVAIITVFYIAHKTLQYHNYFALCSINQSTFSIFLTLFSTTTVLLVRQEFFNHLKLNVCQQCILLTVKQLLFRRNATRIDIFKGGFIGASSFHSTTCSQNDQSNKNSINCTITAHYNNGSDILSMKSTERFPLTSEGSRSKDKTWRCFRYIFMLKQQKVFETLLLKNKDGHNI